jgi:OFA family oxalate/formate antiporter-like MFS transporter
MIGAVVAPSRHTGTHPMTRWGQLAIGIVCMSVIANLQYGWTLFVGPLDAKYRWGGAAIQVAFSIFVLTETWLVPIEGYLVDKYGPKPVVMAGGILCGLAWVMNSVASSLAILYVAAAVGGIGAGAVYGTCIGNALKWFPDRAGLAAGLSAAGFGAGSALTVIPISAMIKASGYEATFLCFGIAQGFILFALSWMFAAPDPGAVPAPARRAETAAREYRAREFQARYGVAATTTRRDYRAREMVRTPVFWVMYVMLVLMAAGGLVVIAQLARIAKDFQVADVPVSILGVTLPALTFAMSLDRVLNGVTRPFFGWVSDHIGRENTMFIAFSLEAIGIYVFSRLGRDPLAFVLLTGLVFFAWGEVFSLFPATSRDTFGGRYAATNAGLLYTAKGTASLLVPLSSVLAERSGGWFAVFMAASVANAMTALAALVILKPLRAGMRSRDAEIAISGRAR